jgi:DNA-binding winged helix-turn-helix (wHTH) protein
MPENSETATAPGRFRLGEWLVEPSLNRLTRGETSVQLEPKAMDVLVFLAGHPGEVLSREAIIDAVWAEDFVGEGVLRRAITVLREALGDDAKKPTYIETITKRGYRLLAEVTRDEFESSAEFEPAPQGFRPRWIALAALAAVAMGLAALLSGLLTDETAVTSRELAPNRVAVVPLENRTGDPSLDTLGVMAADLIVQRFAETGAAEVVPMKRTPEDEALERAREQGAGLLLFGASYLEGDTLRLQARLTDVAAGDLVYAFEPTVVPRAAAAGSIDALCDRVVAAVAAHLEFDIDISVQRPPATYETFQAYRRAEELWGADWATTLDQYQRALEVDPDFHHARISAAFASLYSGDRAGMERWIQSAAHHLESMTPLERARIDYLRARLDLDRVASLEAARRTFELAPQLSHLRLHIGFQAMELNRPAEAVAALEPIAFHVFPSNQWVAWRPLLWLTSSLHMVGDYERELEFAEEGLDRFPDVAALHRAKARALAAMGRIEELDRFIDAFPAVQLRSNQSPDWLMEQTSWELKAHGYVQESAAMASRALEWIEHHRSALEMKVSDRVQYVDLLYTCGRCDEAREHYLQLCEIARNDPRPGVLGGLGAIAARLGDGANAKTMSEKLRVGDRGLARANYHYYRARIAGNLGEKDEAVGHLKQFAANGGAYNVALHSSPFFEALWDYPPFQELIRPKG